MCVHACMCVCVCVCVQFYRSLCGTTRILFIVFICILCVPLLHHHVLMSFLSLYQAAVRIDISRPILLLCFCSFDLFCPLHDKDISIENVYIALSCPIK